MTRSGYGIGKRMTVELYLGDCLEYMKSMPDKSVDAVITDPPYGMGKDFANDTPDKADELFRQTSCEISRICTGNYLSFWSAQRMEKIADFHPKRVLIWNKTFAIYTPNNVGYRYEPILWMTGKDAIQKCGDVLESFPILFKAQSENENHPTQKPTEVMRILINNFTELGDTIFDPFMGSGTTGVACMQLGRNFIGCEIDPTYYAIAEKRIKQAQMQMLLPLEQNVT